MRSFSVSHSVFCLFGEHLKWSSANSFGLEEPEICCLGKNKHSESIAWQYQVPYRLHVFLEL